MKSNKIRQLTLAAILAAIVVLMAFTPLGYLRLGTNTITFLTVPVVVGAITLGPAYGGLLGGIFGVTSFVQCFGMDAMGTAMFGMNPAGMFITCMVPRILIGVVAGALFPLLRRLDRRTGSMSFILTAIAGALTNTIFFLGSMVVFFGNTYFGATALWPLLISLITVNAITEVIVCGLMAALLSHVLTHFVIKQAVR